MVDFGNYKAYNISNHIKCSVDEGKYNRLSFTESFHPAARKH